MAEEMVSQILSRTPPKSLMRFKCVHKSWYALVTDPSFIAQHLHLYNKSSSHSSILFKRTVISTTEIINEEIVFSLLNLHNEYDNDGCDDSLHFIVEDINFPSSMGLKTRGQFIELPIPLRGPDTTIYIKGHSDGIICLLIFYSTSRLVLCNPAIKEFKILPDSISGLNVGFGYDFKSKDYIVVNIFPPEKEEYNDERHVIYPPRAKAYSMGTDSWRDIKTNCLEKETTNFLPNVFEMCYQGIFYWWGIEQKKEYCYFDRYSEEDDKGMIILFDTSDEQFHDILLPHCFYDLNNGCYAMRIAVWKEYIALFGFHSDGACIESLQIWVMADCANCSWIKQLTIVPVVDLTEPLAVWQNNNVLLVTMDGRLATYHVDKERLNFLPIHGVFRARFEAVVFMNSIISVQGGTKQKSKDIHSNIVSP